MQSTPHTTPRELPQRRPARRIPCPVTPPPSCKPRRLAHAPRPSGRGKRPTRRRIVPRGCCRPLRSSRRRRPGSFRICGEACRRKVVSRAGPRSSRITSTERRAISSRRPSRSIRSTIRLERFWDGPSISWAISATQRSRSRPHCGVNRLGKVSTTVWMESAAPRAVSDGGCCVQVGARS